MKLSTLMVYQDDNAHCVNWTTYAAHLAVKFESRLAGVYVGPDTSGLGYFDDVLARRIRKNMDEESSPAKAAERQFEATLSSFEIDKSFKVLNEDMGVALRREARFFNLVVTGQPDRSRRALQDEEGALSHLLIGAGRPVVVVPRNHQKKPTFSRVTIAWDGGRESTRAFFDYLPFLEMADAIEVVTVKSEESSRPFSVARTHKINDMLADMNLQADIRIIDAQGRRSGHLILESAQKHNSDIIVMGAYGHSRLRDLVLGSATRALVKETDIPLFMSH